LGRCQFEAYLNKVFDFRALVMSLPEGREFPQHDISKVFYAVFLGAACQYPSLHEIQKQCRDGSLSKRVGPISDNTIVYALQRQDPEPFFDLGCKIARRLKRNAVLNSKWSRGRLVAGVDGIELFSSFSRCCDECLERKVEKKVKKKLVEMTQYYHRISVVAVISSDIPVPLGIRFQKSGETEVACSEALLTDLVKRLGRRFMDVLVADALYLQTPFVEQIEKLGLEWVITLKDNQPELLAEAERLTGGAMQCIERTEGRQLQLGYAPETYWPVANRSVHTVKARRIEKKNKVVIEKENGKRIKGKGVTIEEATNYYASNINVGAGTPAFINQLGRKRWRMDTELFQTLTTDCHAKRPWAHQSPSLIVITMVRVLAYALSRVYYVRQLCSHLRRRAPTFKHFAYTLATWLTTTPSDSS
jgi:hypothetical protein